MSVKRLKKVTLYGPLAQKPEVISDVQRMGVMHIIPLVKKSDHQPETGTSPQAREALKYLLSCPRRRKQVKDQTLINLETVQERALFLKEQLQVLKDEHDLVKNRIDELKPWGDFMLESPDALKGFRFWFYIIPHRLMNLMGSQQWPWQIINQDNRYNYVAVIAQEEPQDMPIPRQMIGEVSLSRLYLDLEKIEIEIDNLETERVNLTRWCWLFANNLGRLEDQAAQCNAARQTWDEEPLFALQGWVPVEAAQSLQAYSQAKTMALVVEDPGPDEIPPTLLENPPQLASGQDLVLFYMTPNYWLWDPSIVVFFFFSAFFAIILSDAGYAGLMGLVLLLFLKKLNKSEAGRRFRNLLVAVILTAMVWGVLVGSYFGLSPNPGSWLGKVKLLDINDFNAMMNLSLLIGLLHLLLANLANVWHWRSSLKALAPMGWSLIFTGGGLWWFSVLGHWSQGTGIGLLAAGILLILGFSQTSGHWGKRLLAGLQGLTQLSGAFGDTISYLRLFALGLASASLATTFNRLAGNVESAFSGLGLLLSFFIILIGHGINILLAVASGIIHGLRLNFIEFFRWSTPEEGRPFRVFSRKEQ